MSGWHRGRAGVGNLLRFFPIPRIFSQVIDVLLVAHLINISIQPALPLILLESLNPANKKRR